MNSASHLTNCRSLLSNCSSLLMQDGARNGAGASEFWKIVFEIWNSGTQEGSATVPVAAIGVPPMASSARNIHSAMRRSHVRSGRRDADQCARDARDPHPNARDPLPMRGFPEFLSSKSISFGTVHIIQSGCSAVASKRVAVLNSSNFPVAADCRVLSSNAETCVASIGLKVRTASMA